MSRVCEAYEVSVGFREAALSERLCRPGVQKIGVRCACGRYRYGTGEDPQSQCQLHQAAARHGQPDRPMLLCVLRAITVTSPRANSAMPGAR